MHIALLLQPTPGGIGVINALAPGVHRAVMFATLRAKSPRSERIRKDDDKTVSHQSIRPLGVQLCLGVWSLGQSTAIMQGNYCRERAGTVRAIKCSMQDQAVIRNIDLLRCSNSFRTGEGGNENKGQGAVCHDFAALACYVPPGGEIYHARNGSTGRSRSQTGGPTAYGQNSLFPRAALQPIFAATRRDTSAQVM